MSSSDEDCCPICLEEMSDDRTCSLVCGHKFHNQCAVRWLQTQSSSCPVCRHNPRQVSSRYPDVTWIEIRRMQRELSKKGTTILRRKSSEEKRKVVSRIQQKLARARDAYQLTCIAKKEFFKNRANYEIHRRALYVKRQYWRTYSRLRNARRELLTFKASVGVQEAKGFSEKRSDGRPGRTDLSWSDMIRITEEQPDSMFTHATVTSGGVFRFSDLQRWITPQR